MSAPAAVESSVSVTFLDHHIEIVSADPSVLESAARGFEFFGSSAPSHPQESLQVSSLGNGYRLTRNGVRRGWFSNTRALQRGLRHEIVRSFVTAYPNLLWLHAGAAVADGEAVLFLGPSGRGKSTLVASLCSRGWSYATDDIAPVDPVSRSLIPFPLNPVVRAPIPVGSPPPRFFPVTKVRVPLAAAGVQTRSATIAGLVFPEYVAGSSGELLPDRSALAALDLLAQTIHHSGQGGAAVALAARLIHEVPTFRLRFDDAATATDLVEIGLGRRAGITAASA